MTAVEVVKGVPQGVVRMSAVEQPVSLSFPLSHTETHTHTRSLSRAHTLAHSLSHINVVKRVPQGIVRMSAVEQPVRYAKMQRKRERRERESARERERGRESKYV